MPDDTRFELFGGVRCNVGGRSVTIPRGKPGLLLALLLLRADRPVPTSTLIDELWPEDPPVSARALVHTYVSQLRRHLGDAATIETVANGYRARAAPETVDVHRLSEAARSDDPRAWADALSTSAEPLLGGSTHPFVVAHQVSVDDLRQSLQLRAWRHRADRGGDPALLPEVQEAVRSQPLREDLVQLLARTLGAAGRFDDGIAELDALRQRLVTELGMDPSPAHDELRTELSRRRPEAALPARPEPDTGTAAQPPGPRTEGTHERRTERSRAAVTTRGWIVGGALVLALVLLGAAWWGRGDGGGPVEAVDRPTLLRVDADGGVMVLTDLPVVPDELVIDGSTLWLTSLASRTVMWADLGEPTEVAALGLPEAPVSLDAGGSRAVVGLGFSGTTLTVEDGQLSVPSTPVPGVAGKLLVAAGERGISVATVTGEVYGPGTGSVGPPRQVDAPPVELIDDDERLWVLTGESVTAFPATGPGVTSALRGLPVDLSVGGRRAWVVTEEENRVWRTDPDSARVTQTGLLPGRPVAVAPDAEDGAWVAIHQPASVVRLDPLTLEPLLSVDLPGVPVDMATSEGSLLVAVRPFG